jgi:hypothetical protein
MKTMRKKTRKTRRRGIKEEGVGGQCCGFFMIHCVWDKPALNTCRASAESGQGALDSSCFDSCLTKDIQIRTTSRLTGTYRK